MAPELLIPNIQPGDTNWRARVLVIEKGNVSSPKAGKRLQKMVLIDKEGNKVQGVLWDGFIDLFRNSLALFQTYYVRGATVGLIDPKYLKNSNGMTRQWTMSRRTNIDPVTDTDNRIPYPKVPYMSCTDMINTEGSDNRVDLFAVVIDVSPPRDKVVKGKLTPLQECTILQQELRPMVLTLWGEFMDVQGIELLVKKDKYPIILARNLIASTFQGVALATTPVSMIAIDPDVPQASEFKNWVTEHMTIITNIEKTPNQETFKGLFDYSPEKPVARLADLLPNGKSSWVKVQISIVRMTQQLTHAACPKCMYMITADPGETYFCFNCGLKQTAVLRCKANVSITDDSDTLKVTFFDKIAEQVLGKKTEELHSMDSQETHDLLTCLNKRFEGKTFHVQLRVLKKKSEDEPIRYTVQQIRFNEEEHAAEADKATESATRNGTGKRLADPQKTKDTEANVEGSTSAPNSALKKPKVTEV